MNPNSPHQFPDRLVGKISSRQAHRPADTVQLVSKGTLSAASGKKNQRRFRNYLINSSVQVKIAAINLGYMMLVIIVVLLSALIPHYLEIWQSNDLHYQHAAARLFLLLLDRMVLAVAAILMIAFAHQVLITHKICGPLVNFSKTFTAIRNRDLTRKVKLRRSDFLKRTASDINEMVSALAEDIGHIKADHHALERDLAAAADNLHNPQELARILACARSHMDSCSSSLNAFTLPGNMTEDRSEAPAQGITADSSNSPSQRPTAETPGIIVND